MGGNQRERIIRAHLDVHLGETPANVETASTQEEIIVSVRTARGERKSAQHGNMNVRVKAAHVLRIWEIQSIGLERTAQFLQRAWAADFLQCDDVWPQCENAFAHFGFSLRGFGRTS